jgi:pimeloyl-ACP methyl ester carboxylesterase
MSQPAKLRVVRRGPTTEGPGAGRRLVLVHGSMDRANSFTRLMNRLKDWTVVAYDRRGYAGSAVTGPPAAFDDQVGDLIAVLDGQAAVAFGHSFGGDVVLAAAAEHPELLPGALVWEPPQPWLPWWAEGSVGRGTDVELEPDERAERFMRQMVGDRVWERLPSSTRAQRRSEGHTLQAEITSLAVAPVFDAASVRIPVMVGRGGRSSARQRRAARELASALPSGQIVEIDDAGHGAHLTHPADLAALLVRAAASA